MSSLNRYLFMPCFSMTPEKIVTFNKVFYRDSKNHELKTHHDFKTNRVQVMENITEKNVIEKKFHGFEISDNAYRTLKRKITWLHYLAKPKSITTYSGKKIYNFKCAFITLTLPAAQKECTKDFTNLYFNQFLTELRTRTKMLNYVWRLEFQKNGNVHYHLVTDSYIDYFFVLKIWNRILSKGSYIRKYHDKFCDLSLNEYNDLVNPDKKTDFKTIAYRYAKGKKLNWKMPNTVDVKSVIASQSISSYLSKYFAKDSADNPIKNDLDNAENSKSLRLWFCSRSLSKLNTVSDFCEAVNFSAVAIVEGVKNVRKKAFQYATVYYFQIQKLPSICKAELAKIFRKYANSMLYIPAD